MTEASHSLLKSRIQAALERRPGMDEMDLCQELKAGLKDVSDACDELLAEKKIEPLPKAKK